MVAKTVSYRASRRKWWLFGVLFAAVSIDVLLGVAFISTHRAPHHALSTTSHSTSNGPSVSSRKSTVDAQASIGLEDTLSASAAPHTTKAHHHTSGVTRNVNKPEDQIPAQLDPMPILLDSRRNRSYLLFLAVGDWGGPGRQPQRRVAEAMGRVAVGGLSALVPALSHVEPDGSLMYRHLGVGSACRRAEVHEDGRRFNTTMCGSAFVERSLTEGSIDFVVSTGDNIYEAGAENEFDPRFQRNFESVYTHRALKTQRWFMSLGNHDHGAHGIMRDVGGQVRYTKRSDRWFLPSTFYHQRIHVHDEARSRREEDFTVDLIVLDTYDISPFTTKMSEHQLRWFENVLQKSDATWKIVVGHRPIFSSGKKHGSSPYMQKEVFRRLRQHRVALYLCGDDHFLQLLESEGVLFAGSGGGSRARSSDMGKPKSNLTLFQHSGNGFMAVSVALDALAISVHDEEGSCLYRHVVTHA